MSAEPKFESSSPVNSGGYRIVLRLLGLHPSKFGRFKMHDQRRGGDLSHVDQSNSHLNTVLVGQPGWGDCLKAEIKEAEKNNFSEKVFALEAISRKKDAAKVKAQGLRHPWSLLTECPLREGILTANKRWFGGTGVSNWDESRVADFMATALEFLESNFPNGQLRYVAAHFDEEALHIHFVVAVWREKISKLSGRQLLLQPRANKLIANYEKAQDLAGEAFSVLGILRGERRAAAARAAKLAGQQPPARRHHVPPSLWRAKILAEARAEAELLQHAAHGAIEDAQIEVAAQKSEYEKISEKIEAAKKELGALRDLIAQEAARKTQLSSEREEAEKAFDIARAEASVAEAYSMNVREKARMLREKLRLVKERLAEEDRHQKLRRERVSAELAAEREKLRSFQTEVIKEGNSLAGLRAESERISGIMKEEQVALRAVVINRVSEAKRLEEMRREVDAKAAVVTAVEKGIEALCSGVLVFSERENRLKWGKNAARLDEGRKKLIVQLKPARDEIEKLAAGAARSVRTLLSAERVQLAADLTFVSGLREQLSVEQAEQIAKIKDRHDFDREIDDGPKPDRL